VIFKCIKRFSVFKEFDVDKSIIEFIENPLCNSSNRTNMEILGMIVNQIVTCVGVSSYTSGDQECKGAAAILNKNPTEINNKL
jgi:hypothetical protein